MLIDIHAYFGQTTPGAEPPTRLVTYAGVSNVDRVLVANRDGAAEPVGAANDDEADVNAVCLKVCVESPILAPLYWVRPGQLDSNVYTFAGAMQSEPFLGAVFFPGAAGFDASHATVGAYLAALARVKRPALFCITDDVRADPAKIHDQARRFPLLPVILCCADGTEGVRKAMLATVRAAQQLKDANLYIDTAHASSAAILNAVNTLGADRVLWGTDALSYGASHVPRHITVLEDVSRALPTELFDQVTHQNAERLFPLHEDEEDD
jgi:predicted TIM-barrel fold metal-dependent hydrolase